MSKSDSPDPVTVGGEIVYTLKVTNDGPGTATSVLLRDDLPAGTIKTGSTGGCGGGQVTQCNFGTMPNGDSREVLISVRTSAAGTITNRAEVFASSFDPNPGNNVATESTNVVMALREVPAGELELTYRSTLSVKPHDGSVRGRIMVNESTAQETDNASPHIHHAKARPGENRFEAHFESGADGFWRFDFSSSANFVIGSIRVQSGQVRSLDGQSVVFALPASSGSLRFTCKLHTGGRAQPGRLR